MTRPIIIDCDPGADDAVALLLAFGSPELDVLGVTTVAGNVPLDLTAPNALKICVLAGRADVPVFAGCDRPLVRPLETATHVHGETGLGGIDLPDPTLRLEPRHAVDFIIETLLGSDAGVTLAPTGPLTNVATAMTRAPEIVSKIWQIVLMGGAIQRGNVTPMAEFNIYVDPHAAAIVFGSGAPVVMIGLDVTHRALATPEHIDAFDALGNEAGRTVAALLRHYGRPDPERYGGPGVPLHDPCVIAYLLRPDLFDGRPARVSVETAEGPLCGRTFVEFSAEQRNPTSAQVMEHIDASGFFRLLAERLARL